MACPTGRCALRRFDGHGSNSYRPTNPEAARQFNADMERMLAARAQQDGCWLQQPAAAAGDAQQPSKAGLLRQMTPEFGSAAAAAGFPAGKAAAAAEKQQPTGPCWALSS
jgi:hypothetical protein